MTATLKQIDGIAFAAHAGSKHWITMDAPEELGGKGSGSRPMEIVLMGIAGCAAMDVLAILKKKRAEIIDFTVEVHGERADEHPQVFTKIDLKYLITGHKINPDDVQRTIDITDEKYCGAIAMIRPNVTVTHSFEIIEA